MIGWNLGSPNKSIWLTGMSNNVATCCLYGEKIVLGENPESILSAKCGYIDLAWLANSASMPSKVMAPKYRF